MKGGGRRHHGLAHDGRWQRTGRRNHGLARDGRWQCHGRPRHHGLSHDGRPTTDGLRTHLGHDRRRAGRGRSRPRRQEGERHRGGAAWSRRGPPTPTTSVKLLVPSNFSPCRTPVKNQQDPGKPSPGSTVASRCKLQSKICTSMTINWPKPMYTSM